MIFSSKGSQIRGSKGKRPLVGLLHWQLELFLEYLEERNTCSEAAHQPSVAPGRLLPSMPTMAQGSTLLCATLVLTALTASIFLFPLKN